MYCLLQSKGLKALVLYRSIIMMSNIIVIDLFICSNYVRMLISYKGFFTFKCYVKPLNTDTVYTQKVVLLSRCLSKYTHHNLIKFIHSLRWINHYDLKQHLAYFKDIVFQGSLVLIKKKIFFYFEKSFLYSRTSRWYSSFRFIFFKFAEQMLLIYYIFK